LKNGHYILNMVSALRVQPFMIVIDYIKLWLTLAISFYHNFFTRREQTCVQTSVV